MSTPKCFVFDRIMKISTILFGFAIISFSGCRLKRDVRVDVMVNNDYDSISTFITNLSTQEIWMANGQKSFTQFVTAEVGDFIKVEVASFRSNSADTASYIARTFEVENASNYWMINARPNIGIKPINADLNAASDRFQFEVIGDYNASLIEIYVSEDSAQIFDRENMVASNEYVYLIEGLNPLKYIAVKSIDFYSANYYETRKSEVYRAVNYSNFYRNGRANEWIDFEMNTYDYLYWRIPVTKGSWYMIESYDNHNSAELSGKELVLFERGNVEIRTRNPDGRPYFFIAEGDETLIISALAYGGEFGTFRFRLLEISPDSELAIHGEHVFTENNQVIYLKQELTAGTHLIKTYQTDILNQAFIYYSFVVNGKIAQIKEFTDAQLGSNMGPNSREDTAAQLNYITLDEDDTVQMILMNSYHNTPSSLFIELN